MNCKIIEDLLPLYAEGICSEESRAAVEEHIAGCNTCSEKLRLLKTDVPSPVAADDTGAGALKKVKRGILERSLLAASGLLLVIGLGLILAATLLYQSEVENLYLSVFLFLIPFMLFCISTLAGLSGKKKWGLLPALLTVPLVFFGRGGRFSVPLGLALLAAGWFWGRGVHRSLQRGAFARFRKRLWIVLGVIAVSCPVLIALICANVLDTLFLLLLLTLLFPMLFYGVAFQVCFAARGLLRTGLVFVCMAAASGIVIAACYITVRYFEPFELVFALLPAFAGGLTGILAATREGDVRDAAV